MSHVIDFPRDFPGDGLHVKDDPLKLARERVQRRRIYGRLINDGERTYTAYSADELIAIDGEARMSRPGMPY